MLKKLFGIVRGPFLLLVPACLAPAFAQAFVEQGALRPAASLLVVIAALAAHIAVNALNEYEDFRSGLDFATARTPFSGGSGILVADPAFAPAALFTGLTALLVTLSIGLYFFWRVGNALVVPGLVGIAIIVAYTRWINRLPLLCLFAPGIGFGLLFVNLAVLVLTGEFSVAGLWLSLPVTLLVSNLLLVNQFPDIEADRRAGRNHLPIAWGLSPARHSCALLLALAYLLLPLGWAAGALPPTVLLAWLTLPLALSVVRGVYSFEGGDDRAALIPAMGKNVALTLTTPLLMAAGVLLGFQ